MTNLSKPNFGTFQRKCEDHHFYSELQIRGGIEDNSEIIFLFLNKNICCDSSLEPSWQDGSDDGSQYMFQRSNMENLNYPFYPFLSGTLFIRERVLIRKKI